MTPEELKLRMKKMSLRAIRLVEALPKTASSRVLGMQLLRSATGAAANYRSACRGRSRAEFVSKLCIAEEEADETLFWLELLAESGIVKKPLLAPLTKEVDELTAILVSSIRTARRSISNPKS